MEDGSSLAIDTNGSDGWSVSWDTTATTDGSHTLTAIATNTIGQSSTESVTVTVYNGGGTTDPITLSVVGLKQRSKLYAKLTWSGVTSNDIDVYLNGSLYVTIKNDGIYRTGILGQVGGGATFQVFDAGTSIWSNKVSVTW